MGTVVEVGGHGRASLLQNDSCRTSSASSPHATARSQPSPSPSSITHASPSPLILALAFSHPHPYPHPLFSPLTSHLSSLTPHPSPLTPHPSPLTTQLSTLNSHSLTFLPPFPLPHTLTLPQPRADLMCSSSARPSTHQRPPHHRPSRYKNAEWPEELIVHSMARGNELAMVVDDPSPQPRKTVRRSFRLGPKRRQQPKPLPPTFVRPSPPSDPLSLPTLRLSDHRCVHSSPTRDRRLRSDNRSRTPTTSERDHTCRMKASIDVDWTPDACRRRPRVSTPAPELLSAEARPISRTTELQSAKKVNDEGAPIYRS